MNPNHEDYAWLESRVERLELERDLARNDLAIMMAQNERLIGDAAKDYAGMRDFQRKYIGADQRLRAIQAVVDEQAEDEGLWFTPLYISEDFLQRALRRLHAVIEAKT